MVSKGAVVGLAVLAFFFLRGRGSVADGGKPSSISVVSGGFPGSSGFFDSGGIIGPRGTIVPNQSSGEQLNLIQSQGAGRIAIDPRGAVVIKPSISSAASIISGGSRNLVNAQVQSFEQFVKRAGGVSGEIKPTGPATSSITGKQLLELEPTTASEFIKKIGGFTGTLINLGPKFSSLMLK